MTKVVKVISFILIVLVTAAFSVNKITNNAGYEIGDMAADFSLKNVDGNMVSLSDYENDAPLMYIF